MTEAEWLTGTDPKALVKFVVKTTSERKLRLFALAVCVASWRGVGPKRREMHAVTEAFADGIGSVREVCRRWGNSCHERPARWAVSVLQTKSAAQKKLRLALARCVFGNPFRPVRLDRGSISTTIKALAQAAYEERHPSRKELDPTRLAILADALEEASCTDRDILDHLRSPGPHVRGCWALDLLTCRE
jgi:hypothetical protein